MEQYVGMDVSLKETSICVVDGKGEIVSEGTVNSESSAIAAFIKAKAEGAKRIGLETGPTTTWLWHELRALGLLGSTPPPPTLDSTSGMPIEGTGAVEVEERMCARTLE